MTVKACITSMRLRTLPLSLAGIIMGVTLAATEFRLRAPVVVALVLTASLLQILSNLSNELGDTLHGTDTAGERQGMHYSIMDGEMTVAEMKKLIAVIAVLCCFSGLAMVWLSFGTVFALEPVLLLALGASAIWAAMHYTLGRNPYGYRGLGDVFVFIFFGLVSCLGAAYVCSHTLEWLWTLPAAAVGCWSIGVLNVNNIRDMKTDAATRVTVALKLGLERARIYHTVLIFTGWGLMAAFIFAAISADSRFMAIRLIPFITLPMFAVHLRGVRRRSGRELDPMLPMLVMSTFATSLLFFIAFTQ